MTHFFKVVFIPAALAMLLAGCGSSTEPESKQPAADSAASTLGDFDLVPRNVFFGNPSRVQGRVSPDGTRMSFLAPVDGVLNVWVGPLGDFDAAKPITQDTGSGIDSHQWALNSKNVLYIRDTGGDEDFHIYSVDLATGETIDLTPFEKTTGAFVGASYRHPDEYLLGINNRDPRWHDVWRVNVTTGERKLVEQHDRFAGFVADLNLDVRLAMEPTRDGGLTVHKRGEDGEWQSFFKIAKDDALTSAPIAFTDNDREFLMIDSSGRDKAALLLVDVDSDERTVVAESDAGDISGTILDPQTNKPLAYAVNYQRTEWFGVDDAVARDLAHLRGSLPGEISVLGQTRDNGLWIVASDAPKDPLAYYSYDRASGAVSKLFTSRPDLGGTPLNEMHPVSIRARDGLELVSYLTLPPHADTDGDGRPGEPLPMVLDVHGGPWGRNAYGYSSWAQWLSNRGFAVLQVNFRGSTGFGKDFVNAGDMEWAADMHNDLIDAVDWAVAEGVAAPDKVAIAGGSYGGYATLVGLTFTPDKFACGVDIVGPSNLVTLLQSIPPYWESFIETFAQRVGDHRTEEGQKFLRSRSPLYKADQIIRPLLIGQGANDPRVKQSESDQIVKAMQDNDLAVTYVLYPDEGHGFARPENRESFYAIMEAFLNRCLGGRAQAIGDALAGSSTKVPAGAQHVPGLAEALEGFEPTVRN